MKPEAVLKKIILLVIALLNVYIVSGQQVYENLTMNSTTNGTWDIIAKEYVCLAPGFSYDANNSNGSYSAMIDPNVEILPGPDPSSGGSSSGTAGNGIVGLTEGMFNVSPSGAATYSVPIVVSPGTAGMQPELSMVYSSQGGNGVMGRGFSLSGLSVITRVPSTLYHDDEVDGIDFDGKDRFALDGQRLILVGTGQYGADGTQYRTENNTFSKIIARGNTGNGPSWFEVYTKSGLILEYGKTQRLVSSSQGVLYWAIEKVRDRKENYMTFTYDINESQETGEQYILSIDYTINDAIIPSSYASVNFVYEPLASDYEQSSYVNGYEQKVTKRLQAIESRYGSNIVRRYDLGYNYNDNGRVLQLTSIQESDGTGESFNPIVFDWGVDNISNSFIGGLGSSDLFFYSGDFNGDSREETITVPLKGINEDYTTSDQIKFYLNSGSGGLTLNKQEGMANNDRPEFYSVGDVDGDGKDELLESRIVNNELFFNLIFYDEATDDWIIKPLAFTDINGSPVSYPLSNPFNVVDGNGNPIASLVRNTFTQIADFTGDGKGEILMIHYSGAVVIGKVGDTSSSSVPVTLICDEPTAFTGLTEFYKRPEKRLLDFNGDGRTDFLGFNGTGAYFYEFNITSSGSLGDYYTPNLVFSTTDFDSSVERVLPGEHNGDGKTDLMYIESNGAIKIGISKGNAIEELSTGLTASLLGIGLYHYIDIEGDGRSNILLIEGGSGTQLRIKNYDIDFNGFSIFFTPTTSWYLDQDDYINFADYNGDGNLDLFHSDRIYTFYQGKEGHLVRSITNSLGAEKVIGYAPLTDANVYTELAVPSQYPLYDINGPLHVVSSTQTDNGLGGTTDVEFSYEGARVHLEGKGFLGFKKTLSKNLVTGIETENTFEEPDLAFFVTALKRSETRIGASLIATITHVNDVKSYGNKIINYYTTNITKASYNLEGSPTTFTVTDLVYDDYGNITSKTENIGGEMVITTTDTYHNDETNWWLGRLDNTTVVSDLIGAPNSSRTLTTDYDYYADRLLKEVINQDGDPLSTKMTFIYDGVGNVETESVEGGGEIRTTTYTYDLNKRFTESTTNALGHTSSMVNEEMYGNPTQVTDINGFITNYKYDGFGRLYNTIYHDATQESLVRHWAQTGGNAPNNVEYYVHTEMSGEAPTITYYDNMGRELRTENTAFDGQQKIFVDIQYDLEGMVERTSDPYFSGGTAVWTVNEYDDIGRIKKVTLPSDTQEDRIILTTYTGRTTEVNSMGQTTSKTLDKRGQVVEVKDNENNIVTYQYDSHGNLLLTTDPDGNTVEMQYDIFSNKKKLIDPDLGTIDYTYTPFGELETRTDDKGNLTTYTYDLLGRLDTRVEPEGTTDWTYDTKDYGVGALGSVTAPGGISKDYTYDDLGRPQIMNEGIGSESFDTEYTYDAYGRMEKLIYPSGFTLNHVYTDEGYLEQVKEDGGTVYWQAQDINARGQLERFTLGNGLETVRTYKQQTGWLEGITTGTVSGTVQDLGITFDKFGRVEQRKDNKNLLTEDFLYDDLNRLTIASIVGGSSDSVTYDVLGNITYKSDVGTYQYNATQPHAVSGINGNTGTISQMLSTLTWTSFDKVATIAEDGASLAFTYGVSHERKKAVLTVAGQLAQTTLYVGGIYEKKTDGQGAVKELHYIFAGGENVAVYTAGSGAGTRYLHHDHLGSTQSITDETGNLVEELSFDPWGKRRNPDGTALSGSTSFLFERGFTGHEHMDLFALVNMNGRIYDPVIGRFLSADPLLPNPHNLQAFNRYSYAYNSPLTYVDPDGHLPILAVGAAALIGGAINVYANWDHISSQSGGNAFLTGLGYFGVGAAGGVVSAYTAAASFATLGFTATGILSGYAGGFFEGFGNSAIRGGGFLDSFSSGMRDGAFGAVFGGIGGRFSRVVSDWFTPKRMHNFKQLVNFFDRKRKAAFSKPSASVPKVEVEKLPRADLRDTVAEADDIISKQNAASDGPSSQSINLELRGEGAYGGGRKLNPQKGDLNCAGCAIAGDATLKGYPASALNHGVTRTKDVLAHFGKSSWSTGNSANGIINRMSGLGDGATGIIYGSYGPGKNGRHYGHFFNVVNKGGKIHFLDFQKSGSALMEASEVIRFKDLWFINTTN